MAIRSTSASDFLRRTTNLVQGNHAFTCSFWMRYTGTATSGMYRTPFVQANALGPGYTEFAGLFADSSFLLGGINLQAEDGVTFHNTTSGQLTVNTWIPVAYVRSGSSQQLYFGGVFFNSFNLSLSAITMTVQQLLSDGFDSDTTEAIEICSYKEWNIAQSEDNLLDEWNSLNAVVHTSGLVAFTPLTTDALDISGNGNNWTAVGSPIFVADPSFPSNSSQVTALDISSVSFPYSLNTNQAIGGFVADLWLKGTFTPATLLGVWAFGGTLNSGYQPRTLFYNSNLSFTPDVRQNLPGQFCFDSGITCYIRITPENTNITPANLQLSIERLVNQGVPAGSICVNDDTPGLPLIITSATSNTVLKFIQPFPAGEEGAILSDGTLLIYDVNLDTCNIYDGNFNLVTNVAISGVLYIGYDAIQSQFFVMYLDASSHRKIQRVSKTGVIDATIFDLGNNQVKGIVADTTYIYYQINGSTALKRWTIATNIAATDLVATIGGTNTCEDLVILPDGSIVVAYIVHPGNTVKRYDNTGSLLNTYVPTTNGNTADRMAPDVTSGNFIYWSQTNLDPQEPFTFYNIKSSDGTITSKRQTGYEDCAYIGVQADPPSARFGISESCPFWVTRTSSVGTITVGKASPQTNSQIFTMTVGGDTSLTFTIGFQGTEILSLAPGTYSIVETPDPNYNPEYLISNDPVNNNNLAITVNNGDNLAVVIVNNLKTKYGGLYQLVPDKTNDTVKNQDGSTSNLIINWFWKLFIARDK